MSVRRIKAVIKDKKDKTMTFRLTQEEYSWLEKASYTMGSTPSKFVRQLIQMSINAQKASEEALKVARDKLAAEVQS